MLRLQGDRLQGELATAEAEAQAERSRANVNQAELERVKAALAVLEPEKIDFRSSGPFARLLAAWRGRSGGGP